MQQLDRFLGGLAWLYTRLGQAILAALVLSVLLQVIYRYVFSRSILGLEELTKLGLIWLTFLTAAVLHRKRRHIAVTAAYDILSDAARRRSDMVTSAATIILALFLFVQFSEVWAYMMLKSPVHKIPDTWFRSAPLAAFIPIVLQEIVNLSGRANRKKA